MTASEAAVKVEDAGLEAGPEGERYTQVLNALIPYIAKHVDGLGGLASLSQISQDPNVKGFLEAIPEGMEKKLSKILAKYNEFFALLDGGNIATFKGYETGKVDENNNIVKGKMPKTCAGPTAAPSSAGEPAKPAPTPAAAPGGENLSDALDELYQAALQEDNTLFCTVLMKVRRLRNQTFGIDDALEFAAICGGANMQQQMTGLLGMGMLGGPATGPQATVVRGKGGKVQKRDEFGLPTTNLSHQEKNDRHELVIREMISYLNGMPGKKTTMVTVTQHPRILGLKKGVVQKFTCFVDQHSDKFLRYQNPEGATKSEVLELIMSDEQIQQYMDMTEIIHDDYLATYPELMSQEPVAGTGAKYRMGAGGTMSFQPKGKGKKFGKGKY